MGFFFFLPLPRVFLAVGFSRTFLGTGGASSSSSSSSSFSSRTADLVLVLVRFSLSFPLDFSFSLVFDFLAFLAPAVDGDCGVRLLRLSSVTGAES